MKHIQSLMDQIIREKLHSTKGKGHRDKENSSSLRTTRNRCKSIQEEVRPFVMGSTLRQDMDLCLREVEV